MVLFGVRAHRWHPSYASAPSPPWQAMGFKLESLHLYRKVPRDLTDATSVGGAISVVCAMVMAYLFVSNINDYLKMQTTTDVALDDTGEVSMRIFFNITMVRRLAAWVCGLCAWRAWAWEGTRLHVSRVGADLGEMGACLSGCVAAGPAIVPLGRCSEAWCAVLCAGAAAVPVRRGGCRRHHGHLGH